MGPDTVIRDVIAVDESGQSRVDVAIKNGQILELGPNQPRAFREYPGDGMVLTPGGVDPHCHMAQISAAGIPTADDLYSGTRSAIYGGTTTVAAFAAQHHGMDLREVATNTIERVEAEAVVDVALHAILTEWPERPREALGWLLDHGITTIKVFMTYDRLRFPPKHLVEAMAMVADSGMRIMIHAEHDGIVSYGKRKALRDGYTDARGHRLAHSPLAERAGISEALSIAEATGASLYLVHVSTKGSLIEVQAAESRGVDVTVESCPHYLFLDESRLEGDLLQTAGFMSSPPLRGQEDRQALWDALSSGEIDVVASDHAPYRMADGKLPHGETTTFPDVANGLPGVEVRMALMMTAASEGSISESDVVRLCCSNPARFLGLYPQKGTLQPGADADLVLWGDRPTTLTHATLHDAVDYSPFEGFELSTWPKVVFRRGEPVTTADAPVLRAGSGRYVGRAAGVDVSSWVL